MMPVRSDERSNSREARMVELGDEHRRHAVQRGAALGLDGLQHRQRVEGLARDRPCSAPWVGAGQVAEHHAEAVVERHRDADAVALACSAASRR